MAKPKDIVFDDLADPKPAWLQRTVKKLGEKTEVSFTQDAVLSAAREATGLSDFGPDDFKDRLQILLDEYTADDLSGVGRGQMFGDLVRCASNRLIIQDRKNKTPHLGDIKLTRPLSICGLPRSGTTNLVNLLAADSRFQSLPLWVAQEPFCAPGMEKAPLGLKLGAKTLAGILGNNDAKIDDPRYYRCSLRWSGMKIMGPEISSMHPMNPDHIHEELELMTYDFSCNQFEWTSMVPKFRDNYYATDQRPAYEYMRDVLKLIQDDRDDDRPWVLKCVQNPEQLPAVDHAFPDATIVFTHRDPVAVIQSTATMLSWAHRMMRNTVLPPRDVLDYWVDRFERLLKAMVRDRNIWDDKNSIDVVFHEYMADPLATVEKVHELYGIEFTDKARSEIDAYIKAHPRGKHGRVRYNLEEHFGISAGEIRERFQFYFDAFPIKAEVE